MVAVKLLPRLFGQVEEFLGTPQGASPLGELEHAPFQTAESFNQAVKPPAQIDTVEKSRRMRGPLSHHALRSGQRQVWPGREDVRQVPSCLGDQLSDRA